LKVVREREDLRQHRALLEQMDVNGVSSDVSDPNCEEGREFTRVSPVWRSDQLAGFLWRLDEVVKHNRIPKIGHRRIRGQQPRIRHHSTTQINHEALAPPGLPRNCYSEAWLATLRPHELNDLRAKDNYDFNLGGQPQSADRIREVGALHNDGEDEDFSSMFTDET
jgi:hypothetical protein